MKKLILVALLTAFQLQLFSQDLIIESIETNASYHQYEGLSFSITIRNIGILPSESNYAYIYLNTDSTIFSGYIGDVSIPGLGANESITLLENLEEDYFRNTITKAAGKYYVLGKINTYGNKEVNVDNNYYVGEHIDIVESTADLTIDISQQLNTTYLQGGAINIVTEAMNSGSPVYSTYVTAYLSTDQILDGSDIKLPEEEDYIPFYYTSTDNSTLNYYLPNNTVVGDYYLILKIDGSGNITETDETNNTTVSSLFSVESSDIQLEITNGNITRSYDYIDVQFDISNKGSDNAEYYNVSYYASIDGNSQDYPLTEGSINSNIILPNQSKFFNESIFSSIPDYYEYIIIVNDDPAYPIIAPFSIYLGPPPVYTYDFNINSIQLAEVAETTDDFLYLDIEIENPNYNPIYESAYYYVTLVSADGLINEQFTISENLYIYTYETITKTLTVENRSSLKAGNYAVTVSSELIYEEGFAEAITDSITILSSENTMDVEILGQNGDIINQGIVYLYEKTSENVITFVESQEITEVNNKGQVSFQRVDGDYMFYVVPDNSLFPDYLRTVSGNTFDLKGSSFIQITNDTIIPIAPIYVDPNLLNGSKIIKGNLADGTSSKGVSYKASTNGTTFNETPVYLIKDGQVIAHTKTNSTGYYQFENVEEGDYDIYFDDGDIIAANDIDAIAQLATTDDILQIDVDETGTISKEVFNMDVISEFKPVADIFNNELSIPLTFAITSKFHDNDVNDLNLDFWVKIIKDNTPLDSVQFSQIVSVPKSDTILINKTIQLPSALTIGAYNLKISATSKFQADKIFIADIQSFQVTEAMFTIDVLAKYNTDQILENGSVQLYTLNETLEPVLLDEKALNQNGSVQFTATEMDYFLYLKPDTSIYSHLLPTFSPGRIDYQPEENFLLGSNSSHTLEAILNQNIELNGTRTIKTYVDSEGDFYSDAAIAYLVDPVDKKVLKSTPIINGTFEFKHLTSGEHLFFIEDGFIDLNYDRWLSLNLNNIDDFYEVSLSGGEIIIDSFDFDFEFVNPELYFKAYNTSNSLIMAVELLADWQTPRESFPVDFLVQFVKTNTTDTTDFYFQNEIFLSDLENFYLDHYYEFDNLLEAGEYSVTYSYKTSYNQDYTGHASFEIEVLDCNIVLQSFDLLDEVFTNDSSIQFSYDIQGSSLNDLTDLPLDLSYLLLKGNDTVSLQKTNIGIDIKENETLSFTNTLDLNTLITPGDYELILGFYPVESRRSTDQQMQISFHVKNNDFAIEHLDLKEYPNILSDSIHVNYILRANSDDAIIELMTNRSITLVNEANEVLFEHSSTSPLSINKAQSLSEQFSLATKDLPNEKLVAGNYSIYLQFNSPVITETSVISVYDFRVLDPSFTVEAMEIVSNNTDSIKVIELSAALIGNQNDAIDSLAVKFNLQLEKDANLITETSFIQWITINIGGQINLDFLVPLEDTLSAGDYVIHISYQSAFMVDSIKLDPITFEVLTPEVLSTFSKSASTIKIYPNPAKDFILITGEFNHVSLYDLSGKQITLPASKISANSFDISILQDGIYLLKVESKNGIETHKFIKE